MSSSLWRVTSFSSLELRGPSLYNTYIPQHSFGGRFQLTTTISPTVYVKYNRFPIFALPTVSSFYLNVVWHHSLPLPYSFTPPPPHQGRALAARNKIMNGISSARAHNNLVPIRTHDYHFVKPRSGAYLFILIPPSDVKLRALCQPISPKITYSIPPVMR